MAVLFFSWLRIFSQKYTVNEEIVNTVNISFQKAAKDCIINYIVRKTSKFWILIEHMIASFPVFPSQRRQILNLLRNIFNQSEWSWPPQVSVAQFGALLIENIFNLSSIYKWNSSDFWTQTNCRIQLKNCIPISQVQISPA